MAADPLLTEALNAFDVFVVGELDDGRRLLSRDGRTPADDTVVFLEGDPDTEMSVVDAERQFAGILWMMEPEIATQVAATAPAPPQGRNKVRWSEIAAQTDWSILAERAADTDATPTEPPETATEEAPATEAPAVEMPAPDAANPDETAVPPAEQAAAETAETDATGGDTASATPEEFGQMLSEAERRVDQLEGLVATMVLDEVGDETFDQMSGSEEVLPEAKQGSVIQIAYQFGDLSQFLGRVAAVGNTEITPDMEARLQTLVDRLEKLEATITEMMDAEVEDEELEDEEKDEAPESEQTVIDETVPAETDAKTAAFFTNARGVRVWHDPSTGKFAPAGFISPKVLMKLWKGDAAAGIELDSAVRKARSANPGMDMDSVVAKVLGPVPTESMKRAHWDAGRRRVGRMWPATRGRNVRRAGDGEQYDGMRTVDAVRADREPVRPMDGDMAREALRQMGAMNVAAVSGGRYQLDGEGRLELPVSNGYFVRVSLTPGDDYTVERVFRRSGVEYPKGRKERIYFDELGEEVYRASSFRSYGYGDQADPQIDAVRIPASNRPVVPADRNGWRNADLRGVDLRREDLSGYDMSGADLDGAQLSRAELVETNLSKAILGNTEMYAANLYKANLSGAGLTNTQLMDADLRGANLTGADFYNVDLQGADLRGADLTGAKFERTDLSRAMTDDTTRGLEGQQIDAIRSDGATFPNGAPKKIDWPSELPGCDICGAPAAFDVPTSGNGRWANLCALHVGEFGGNTSIGFERVKPGMADPSPAERMDPDLRRQMLDAGLTDEDMDLFDGMDIDLVEADRVAADEADDQRLIRMQDEMIDEDALVADAESRWQETLAGAYSDYVADAQADGVTPMSLAEFEDDYVDGLIAAQEAQMDFVIADGTDQRLADALKVAGRRSQAQKRQEVKIANYILGRFLRDMEEGSFIDMTALADSPELQDTVESIVGDADVNVLAVTRILAQLMRRY